MAKYNKNAHAKVNIGLSIKERRDDGFHNIETIFHLLDLHDEIALYIDESDKTEIAINYLNIVPNWQMEDDLMYKAALLFLSKANKKALIKIDIIKNIPPRAGLGGGSSDAAAVIAILNEHYHNLYTIDELIKESLAIGSDIAFFLSNYLCARGEGRGEILKMETPVSFPVVIIVDGKKKSTKEMYGKLDMIEREISTLPPFNVELCDWGNKFTNDFGKISQSIINTKVLKKNFSNAYFSISGAGGSHFIVLQDNNLMQKLLDFLKMHNYRKNVILITKFSFHL